MGYWYWRQQLNLLHHNARFLRENSSASVLVSPAFFLAELFPNLPRQFLTLASTLMASAWGKGRRVENLRIKGETLLLPFLVLFYPHALQEQS